MRKTAPKRRVLTPEALKSRLASLGLSQAAVASEWSISDDTVSRWMTGRAPIPGWVSYALDGIEHARIRKLATDRGYPWPPIGYNH